MMFRVNESYFEERPWEPIVDNIDIYGAELPTAELSLSGVRFMHFNKTGTMERHCDGFNAKADKLTFEINGASHSVEQLLLEFKSTTMFDTSQLEFDFIYSVEDPQAIILLTGGYLDFTNSDIIAAHLTRFDVKPSKTFEKEVKRSIFNALIAKGVINSDISEEDLIIDEPEFKKLEPIITEMFKHFLKLNIRVIAGIMQESIQIKY